MNYKQHGPWVVPEWDGDDVLERRVYQAAKVQKAIPDFLDERGVIVQAGGNWGAWPAALSTIFDTVYTFEPDSECFSALCINTSVYDNIVRFQAALGNEHKLVGITREEGSTGSQKAEGLGIIPTLQIDDLNLPKCDMIYLDIEGGELEAFWGAEETIRRCHPMVAFEDRPFDMTNLKEWLGSFGYKDVGRIVHDQLMAC